MTKHKVITEVEFETIYKPQRKPYGLCIRDHELDYDPAGYEYLKTVPDNKVWTLYCKDTCGHFDFFGLVSGRLPGTCWKRVVTDVAVPADEEIEVILDNECADADIGWKDGCPQSQIINAQIFDRAAWLAEYAAKCAAQELEDRQHPEIATAREVARIENIRQRDARLAARIQEITARQAETVARNKRWDESQKQSR